MLLQDSGVIAPKHAADNGVVHACIAVPVIAHSTPQPGCCRKLSRDAIFKRTKTRQFSSRPARDVSIVASYCA